MVSPPKPWERGSVTSAATVGSSTAPSLPSSPSTGPASSPAARSAGDSLPQRPPALTNPPASSFANSYNNPMSSYSTPYGGYNSSYGAGGYASGYNRFGSSYSPYGAGYGGGMYGGTGLTGYGMNGMYGGVNGMYGGMGMPGMPGMPIDPNNPSLTQTLESTTSQTFQLLQSIVHTFTGLSQMLESTFMATHSSFFAMVGVVDQFSHLRNALGSVLGVFGLVRWVKETLLGRRGSSSMQHEFRDFINGRPVQGPPGPPAPRPSKKPLIIFLLAIFGVPYAMHKLIKVLTERAQTAQSLQGPHASFDPSTLTFARAKYAFVAANPSELALKENEIVAIMGKLDPNTGMEVDPRAEVETDWWKGRTREGREGWFPSKWVDILERKKPDGDEKSLV